jgi:phosphate starvation-inducible PhoH-like protein
MIRVVRSFGSLRQSANKKVSITCSASKITPKNEKQKHYVNLLRRTSPYVVIASGTAGSGKTLLATSIGVEKLINKEVEKLIITRPTVPVGDDIGYLPGTLNKKMEPWIKPIYDSLSMQCSISKIEKMIQENVIEVCPLTFMRGRTFQNAWIICDEAQNTTIDQMLMVLTRIGPNSKMVITGDPMQHDRQFGHNGLVDIVNKVGSYYKVANPYFEVVEFTEEDVERHPIIPEVVRMYKDTHRISF